MCVYMYVCNSISSIESWYESFGVFAVQFKKSVSICNPTPTQPPAPFPAPHPPTHLPILMPTRASPYPHTHPSTTTPQPRH